MKRLILALLVMPVFGQVDLLFTPISPATSGTWGLKSGAYVWNISIWNRSAETFRISPEIAMILAPEPIPFLTSDQGITVFTAKAAMTKRQRAARAIEYGLMGAAAFSGLGVIATSSRVTGMLVVGAGFAREVEDRILASEPSSAAIIGSLMREPMSVEPGATVTKTMFSGKMSNPKTMKFTVMPAALQAIPQMQRTLRP